MWWNSSEKGRRQVIGVQENVITGMKESSWNSIALSTLSYASEIWTKNVAEPSCMHSVEMIRKKGTCNVKIGGKMVMKMHMRVWMWQQGAGFWSGWIVKAWYLKWFEHVIRITQDVFVAKVKEIVLERPPLKWNNRMKKYWRGCYQHKTKCVKSKSLKKEKLKTWCENYFGVHSHERIGCSR